MRWWCTRLFLPSVLVIVEKKSLKLIQCWLECSLADLISVTTAHMVYIFLWFSSFIFDGFVHLSQHIYGGPWSNPCSIVREGFGEKFGNRKPFKPANLLQFFFLLFSFFLISFFRIHMHYLTGNVFQGNRSPVLDEVDRNASFQHLADIQQHSFIVSPAADLMFKALAAVYFFWHKSCIIWRCRDEQSGVRPQTLSRVP